MRDIALYTVVLIVGIIGISLFAVWFGSDQYSVIVTDQNGVKYSCIENKLNKTPHECKPVKEMK